MINLSELKIGQSAKIESVGSKGATRQHLLDMGIIPNTIIKFVKLAPLGDPMEFKLRGYSLSLRKDDARSIKVTLIDEKEDTIQKTIIRNKTIHPGLGENGINYHDRKTGGKCVCIYQKTYG